MKITFIGKYPPIFGGESTKLYWASKELGERGHQINIITDAWEKNSKADLDLEDLKYIQPNNVKLHSTNMLNLQDHEKTFLTERLSDLACRSINEDRADILVGWYYLPYGSATSIVSKFSDIPYVLQHAGSDMKKFFSSQNLMSYMMNQFANADGIMSYPSYERTFRRFNKNVFIHNPKLNISELESCPDYDFGEELQDKQKITFLGKLEMQKGVHDLLNAYIRLNRKEVALLYVGEGNEKEVLKRRVREKELDNVHFRKPIPPWRVPGLIRASDVYFVGERDFYVEKHFSRKPMEALACQTPLIVSPEVKRKGMYIPLQHEIHCLEIYPKNTDELVKGIEKLLDDKNYAESMTKKGYEFALEKNQGFREYITSLETFLKNISHKET